jgi:hypothetical protein
MDGGVEFVACDFPQANRLMLHVMAAFAEHEREQIAERTKAALAAARARGVKLGTNGKVLAEQNRKKAMEFAEQLRPIVTCYQGQGARTYQQLADRLNADGHRAQAGGTWNPTPARPARHPGLGLGEVPNGGPSAWLLLAPTPGLPFRQTAQVAP